MSRLKNINEQKPTVLIIDDDYKDPKTRKPIRLILFGELIGDIANLHGISFFTRNSLKKGDVGVGREPEDILKYNPELILLDLELIKDTGDWKEGLQYIYKKLRTNPLTKKIPVLIVSQFANEAKSSKYNPDIPVDKFFMWGSLMDDRENERDRFKKMVKKILECKSKKI